MPRRLLAAAAAAPLWAASAAAGACRRPNVGGQAVIEGVMMRGPSRWTVAVRREDGRIETTATPYVALGKRFGLLGRPVVRGAVVLWESLVIGLKALNFSAEMAAQEGGEAKKGEAALGFWALAGTLAVSLALAAGLFVALPHVASLALGRHWGFDESSIAFHLADGLIKFALFIGYVWAIGFIPDIRRVFAYHGAEHKAIYTFEAGEGLTVENARGHSTHHPRCGTAFIFLVLALSILFFAAVFPLFFHTAQPSLPRTLAGIGLKVLLMLPLAGLAYEVTRLAAKGAPGSMWRFMLWPGLALQGLTTRQPDDSQMEVALESLKEAVAPGAEPC